jgi:hypothetical protein
MLLIGVQNPTTQDVVADGIIETGNSYRKFDEPNSCGQLAFSNTSTGITLHRKGIYHITANFYPSAAFTGTIQMLENNIPVLGATANGENLTIDYLVVVDPQCGWTSNAKTITFTSDTALTLENVVVNITKEVY